MSSKKNPPADSEKEKAVAALVYRLGQAGYGRGGEERETFAREYVDMMWARGLRVLPVGRAEEWKTTTGQPVGDARTADYAAEARAALAARASKAPAPRRDHPGAA